MHTHVAKPRLNWVTSDISKQPCDCPISTAHVWMVVIITQIHNIKSHVTVSEYSCCLFVLHTPVCDHRWCTCTLESTCTVHSWQYACHVLQHAFSQLCLTHTHTHTHTTHHTHTHIWATYFSAHQAFVHTLAIRTRHVKSAWEYSVKALWTSAYCAIPWTVMFWWNTFNGWNLSHRRAGAAFI